MTEPIASVLPRDPGFGKIANMSNMQSIRGMAARLTGIQTIHPPSAPGASIVMGLYPQANKPMTFAGCCLDPSKAFEACMGEAAEFLAQHDPRATLEPQPAPNDAIAIPGLTLQGLQSWLPAMGLPDRRLVSLPAASCCYLPESSHLDISTGCAAGRNIEEAISHALCETIERNAARGWWQGTHQARHIELSHPALVGALNWLSQARGAVSGRDVLWLDIGGDAIIPVVAAVSFLTNGIGCVVGTAAHSDFARAAIAAARELVQMEFGLLLATMKREHTDARHLDQADLRHLRRAEVIDRSFPALKAADPTIWSERKPDKPGWEDLACRLIDRGHPVYIARLSSDPFLPVVRVLVGGLPIAQRAKHLTYNAGIWEGIFAVELY